MIPVFIKNFNKKKNNFLKLIYSLAEEIGNILLL